MTYLLFLYFYMNISFWGYIIYILIKYGILPSVSDSYYALPLKGTYSRPKIIKENGSYSFEKMVLIPNRDLFRLFTLSFSLPAMIIGLNLSTGSDFQFLMFLAGSGIAFVGAAPDFKSLKTEEIVHVVAALTGVICNTLFLFIVFTQYWYIPALFVVTGLPIYFMKKKIKNTTYWVELMSFATFSITIGIVLFG